MFIPIDFALLNPFNLFRMFFVCLFLFYSGQIIIKLQRISGYGVLYPKGKYIYQPFQGSRKITEEGSERGQLPKKGQNAVKCCSGYNTNQLWVPMHNLHRIQPVDILLWIQDGIFFLPLPSIRSYFHLMVERNQFLQWYGYCKCVYALVNGPQL